MDIPYLCAKRINKVHSQQRPFYKPCLQQKSCATKRYKALQIFIYSIIRSLFGIQQNNFPLMVVQMFKCITWHFI